MSSNQYPEFRLDSFNLVNFLFRYWKLFLGTGIVAFIISAAVSLTITPLYQSELILYPASTITESGLKLFSTESSSVTFGDEEATEKILQLAQSDMIKDFLAEKYDLFNHYDIDPEAKYRQTLLLEKMDKYISFRKTEFMSVKISVLDPDPDQAAGMANDIAGLIDRSFNELLMDAGKKLSLILESQYMQQIKLVRSYEDSLRLKDGYSVTGYQSDLGVDGIIVSPYSPELIRFSENHKLAIEDLGLIRQKYTEARIAAEEEFSYTLIVNDARPAEKKAFPKRSVITIISTLSALLFLMFVLIIIDGLVYSKND